MKSFQFGFQENTCTRIKPRRYIFDDLSEEFEMEKNHLPIFFFWVEGEGTVIFSGRAWNRLISE